MNLSLAPLSLANISKWYILVNIKVSSFLLTRKQDCGTLIIQ